LYQSNIQNNYYNIIPETTIAINVIGIIIMMDTDI